ncbi:MAG: phosphoribosylaminoimidazolesuccinocarboxamide synthase [Chloroflexota bacterium]
MASRSAAEKPDVTLSVEGRVPLPERAGDASLDVQHDNVEVSGCTSSLGPRLFRRGKARDVYEVDGGRLLFVASDRLSAFDVVLPDQVPLKGQVLNRLSAWWFEETRQVIPNHFLSLEVPIEVAGRAMLVRRAERLDVEAVVRGYLCGSGWLAYQRGDYENHGVPAGIPFCGKLPEPIFTPTTKAEAGHDQPLSFAELESRLSRELAAGVKAASLALYRFAAERCERAGILLADSKFEFGLVDGQLMAIDELLTPDSSRFWPAGDYAPGRAQRSFDKQYVRDYLESTGWNKQPPAPALPAEVIQRTTGRYVEAYERITGQDFPR